MKCKTKYCRNEAAPSRKVCLTCNSRNYRKRNPIRYSYLALKHNAKRRKKEFTISYDYFQQFCYETDYIAGKGRSKLSYTVDRIDETKGYVPGNLQKLTNEENNIKYRKHLHYDYQTKSATVTTETTDRRESDQWDTGFDAAAEW